MGIPRYVNNNLCFLSIGHWPPVQLIGSLFQLGNAIFILISLTSVFLSNGINHTCRKSSYLTEKDKCQWTLQKD
jgi:hypothetical protein